MANEEEVIEEQGKTVDNELETLRAEKARLESELSAKHDADEKFHASELARTKAEAELNATKSFLEAQRNGQVSQVTEEQWKALEESTGVPRGSYIANAQITQQQVDGLRKELVGQIRASEEKATKAQEKLEKMSQERSYEKTQQAFLEAKPQLARYKNDLKEFVNMFSEQDRNDPEKMKDILSKAEVYVKGKVGDKMRLNAGGSPKLGGGNEELDDTGSNVDFDPIGLQTDAQVRLVRDLNLKNSGDALEKDQKLLTKFQSADKQGVAYSAADEWAETQAKFGR